ncbi:hypothetical protein DH2020_034897 [Rehmannia glutinosa]|uniref:Uncharacterized protein n=1 Tax=Rehmannia glutinosa TaxID=99300 RepID=A0ABR0VAL6_REHGL
MWALLQPLENSAHSRRYCRDSDGKTKDSVWGRHEKFDEVVDGELATIKEGLIQAKNVAHNVFIPLIHMAENASFQPQEEQPDSKRQKMSTTTTSGDEENHENSETTTRKPKYKRRKVAIFFAYCGVGYQGMQKNPGAKTIEGDLEEALYFSGAIPEEERGQHRRFDWARSARTDKGVSAVGQVVSGRFYVDPPGFVERLNSHLAPQIRIFGYKRATPSFNAKKFCDRRRYVYLIPVFALDPSCHRDRESVMASLGSGSELVKCLECSERGRKVLELWRTMKLETMTLKVTQILKLGNRATQNENDESALAEKKTVVNSSENNETGNNDSENNSNSETGKILAAQDEKMEDEKAVSVENNIVVNSLDKGIDNTNNDNASPEPGKLSENGAENRLECENANDDTKIRKEETKAEDPAAKRYILSFNANTVISIDGIDFVKCGCGAEFHASSNTENDWSCCCNHEEYRS